jgi:hypothetical protein
MKLDDFERSDDKGYTRLVSQVQDVSGDELFELTIAGPEKLVREVLADATIELTIDSARSVEDMKPQFDEWSADHRKQMWSLAGLENVDDLFKPAPAAPQRDTTVLAAVRPIRGEGTPFAFSTGPFFLPVLAVPTSFVFFGSLVVFANGAVFPASGDQDLYLHLFGPTGPVMSSSRAGGTTPDFVFLTIPTLFGPIPFVPVFEVRPWTTGVCANFTASGA